ncbi:MAG: hypothetical protein H0W08_08325 [Acidobacteria bacterium]|nr:hypothetical protein [Acidobacteriota bacterium]
MSAPRLATLLAAAIAICSATTVGPFTTPTAFSRHPAAPAQLRLANDGRDGATVIDRTEFRRSATAA